MQFVQTSVIISGFILVIIKIAATDITHTVVEEVNVIEDDLIAVGKGIAHEAKTLANELANKCQCIKTSCGCCEHLEEAKIHLNSSVCVNVTYLSEDYGISVTATINDYAIFNETVSARNPPPICVGAPYVENLADLCLRFHDMNATRHSVYGCVKAEARVKRLRVVEYELGCFNIGKNYKVSENETTDKDHIVPNVYLV